MDALQTLRSEHESVSLVVAAARRDIDAAAQNGCADADDLARLIDFFRYFMNSCHAPKEDDLLFPALHHRGLAWEASPLCRLVREHEALRVMLDSASGRLLPFGAGEAGALQPLLSDLAVYLDLLTQHIAEEEDVVFPLAQERLTAHDLDELGRAFDAIACDELDEGMHAYYADVAHRLAGAAA